MISRILVFLAQLQPQQEDEPGKWRNLLPLAILMVMYALSSLLKGKQKRNPTEPRESPTTEQTKPLPSYTRKLPSYARKSQAGQPAHRTTIPIELPKTVSRIPVPPATNPAPWRPQPQVKRQKIIKPPREAFSKSATKTQMLSTDQSARLRQLELREKEKVGLGQKVTAKERLQSALREREGLASAIVMAEILGKPVGLRQSGQFELIL